MNKYKKIRFISVSISIFASSILYAEIFTGLVGGECVKYARVNTGNDYTKSPALGIELGDGAHEIYDDWDYGYGKGDLPKINSLLILDSWNKNPYGHVAIVKEVKKISDTIYNLYVDESNWHLDKLITTHVYYQYNIYNKTIKREYTPPSFRIIGNEYNGNLGSTTYNVKGFVYTEHANYQGTFDGAGSLVNPLDQGAGRNFDIVKLHPHDNSGSVGVFQWKYDNNFCSKIELFSSSSLGDVLIQVKGWSDHTFKQSFKVNLKAKEKVTIESDSYWTTLALTTLEPLDHRTDLIARCATDNDEFYNANREEVEANLVDVTNDYYWTGTGSLITDSDNLEDGGFGYMLDLATTYSSMKGLTSFQWKATDRCSDITISKAGLTEKVAVNGISIKKWDKATWSNTGCNNLPCSISKSPDDSYYVIKIKTNANALDSQGLLVECD